MLELFYKYWDEILSILAIAVALVPPVVKYINIKNRKISANIVDYRIVTNAKVCNHDSSAEEKGTILLLAVNLFVSYESFFVEGYEFVAQLKSGSVSKAIITDGDLTIRYKDSKDRKFIMPAEYNFNLHKEIICERDNIRILEIMLMDSVIETVKDIKSITLILKNRRCKKRVVLKDMDFPNFNKMRFLSEFEKEQ